MNNDNLIALSAGALAGIVCDLVMHPVDTIRTRLIMQRGTPSVDGGDYRNLRHGFATLARREGLRAFYKGLGVVLAFTTPAHALYFAGYEGTKRALRPSRGTNDKGVAVHFAAGQVAEAAGALLWTPMDVVKQRVQVQRSTATTSSLHSGVSKVSETSQFRADYANSWRAFQSVYRSDGVGGFYRGFGAGLLTYGPFVGIYFVCYEECKSVYFKAMHVNVKDSSSSESIPTAVALASGALSGAVAAAITTPLDVLKTRIQTEAADVHVSVRYDGILHAARTILREEGVRAFAKGLSARVTWIAPGTALTIAAYERFKTLLSMNQSIKK